MSGESFGATVNRSTRIGSTTSMRIGPDARGPIDRHAPGREDGVLDAVDDDAERGVDDAEHRVVPHRAADVEGAVALVSVEEVAVVVVGVRRRWRGHGIGVGVDRIVVPGCEHACGVPADGTRVQVRWSGSTARYAARMTTANARPEVIDSDGHVVEPDSLWDDYSEPEFREQLDVPGGGWVQVTGIMRGYPDLGTALPGSTPADDDATGPTPQWPSRGRKKPGRRWGGRAATTRTRGSIDMDDEGIDVAVLYPTAMLTWVEEADVFGAACRAYNNWLRDYCSAAPTRLYGVGLVPLQDIDAAITEMRRCVRYLSFKAVMVRPAAYIGTKKLNHPDYDPFWAAAAELGCPIGVHPSPHGDMVNACRLLGLADGVTNPSEGLALRQGLTNAIDLQMATAYFTLGGICERHPELRSRSSKEPADGWCRCSNASTTSSRSSGAATNARCRANCSPASAW